MESEGPQLPAVGFHTLNHVCLVTHSGADVISERNVVSKNVHVGAALQRAWYVLSQRPEHQTVR